MTEKINDFIHCYGLQRADLLTKHQWLQSLYYKLGVAYLEAGKLSQALSTLLKIAALSLIKHNVRVELSYHTNLGVVYEEMRNPGEAKTHCQLALTIHEQKSADPNVGHQYNALANLYLQGSDLLNAAACYRNSIKWSKYYKTRNKAPRYIGWAQYGLAKIACYLNDQPAAIHYLNEFIGNINLIFPNWSPTYKACLKSLENSIISIRISKPISSGQRFTADTSHYRLFSISYTSDSDKKDPSVFIRAKATVFKSSVF